MAASMAAQKAGVWVEMSAGVTAVLMVVRWVAWSAGQWVNQWVGWMA